MINIANIDKAVLLQALHANSHALGMGVLHDKGNLTLEECQTIIAGCTWGMYFDYVRGRIIKCDIGGDEFDPRLYDRDNGHGAALRVVDSLRSAARSAACMEAERIHFILAR